MNPLANNMLRLAVNRVAGCLLSLLVGWTAYFLFVSLMSGALQRLVDSHDLNQVLKDLGRVSLRGIRVSWPVAYAANLIFAGLYLFTPRHWIIWRGAVALGGGASGGFLFGLMIPLFHHHAPIVGWALFTAVTGAATCLAAALIDSSRRKTFHENPQS